MKIIQPDNTTLYCTVCGNKLIHGSIVDSFDLNTGQPAYRYYCPSDLCGHIGVKHNFIATKWYEPGDMKCTKCNYTCVFSW